MVANSRMKHESETMLEVIRGLVLHFVLHFVTVLKVPFICDFRTVQHKIQYT